MARTEIGGEALVIGLFANTLNYETRLTPAHMMNHIRAGITIIRFIREH